MSIETIHTTSSVEHSHSGAQPPSEHIETTPAATPSVKPEVSDQVLHRKQLHDELAAITLLLHELQTRHTTLTLGLIALAEQLKTASTEHLSYTRTTIAEEHRELATKIDEKRTEQRIAMMNVTNYNQTVWRPNGEKEEEKAERRRIEQPYIIEIYNNGEDPTQTAGLPEHLVGTHYRYLSNAPL